MKKHKKYLKLSNSIIKQGFTLIELMIVIAIIGILAVIAVPQYTSYIARSQATEAIYSVAGGKAAAAEFLATNGRYPITSEFWSVYPLSFHPEDKTKYIQSIAVYAGQTGDFVLVLIFKTSGISSLLAGKTLIFRSPKVGNSLAGIRWECQVRNIDYEVVPAACRNSEADIS